MAKKETLKDRELRRIKFLTENTLTEKELRAIRKLNGATMVYNEHGKSIYSRRTIESVLQGRRNNPQIIKMALDSAVINLKELQDIIEGILKRMGG